jgi:hypothetical protein
MDSYALDQARTFWLYEQLAMGNDVLILDVLEKVGDGTRAVARIRHCYTDLYASVGRYASGSVSFGVGMGTFGNKHASPGESVVIAIGSMGSRENARMYENHWQGNFLLQEIDGALYAVARFELPEQELPPFIRSALVPIPPFFSAIPFPLLEDYLMAVIPAMHGIEAVRSPFAGASAGSQEAGRPAFRLPGKMMSRQDFMAFRRFAQRRRAYLVVCTSSEPRNPWPSPNGDSESPFMQRYCLHGVYSEDRVSLWRPGTGEQIRSELNDALGGERIVFGPLDNWEYREQPQSRMLLFLPDGDAEPLIYHPDVNQRHITGLGLPWPFPTSSK